MKYKRIGILISLAVLSVFAVKAEAAAPTNGLVGYWNFGEGSGMTAGDSSPDATVGGAGNGNNGTVNGASRAL